MVSFKVVQLHVACCVTVNAANGGRAHSVVTRQMYGHDSAYTRSHVSVLLQRQLETGCC